jgi:hypothetical protein
MRRWHWSLALAAAFAAVVGLTLALRGGQWAAAQWRSSTGGAQWIWVAHERRVAQPLSFYLVRDFSLAWPGPPETPVPPGAPAAASPPMRARLLVLGDQEYILYLNGRRIGAGAWRPGARADVYEVGGLLRPGGNRLLAELRSANSAGGFLAGLVDEASGRALVATDAAWRSFRRHHLGLMRGWLPADPAVMTGGRPGSVSAAGRGEGVVAWGRPPLGRWGRVVPGRRRPTFEELTAGRRPELAAAATPYRPPPASGVAADDSMTLFDWGRQVTGYLALEPDYLPGMDPDLVPPPPDRQRTALLWTGDTPPEPTAAGSLPGGAVMLMASSRQWLDARLRRFRYALVIGLQRPLAARVYLADEALIGRFRLDVLRGGAGGLTPRGVFGLPPPRLRSPVEDEVRRKLQRLASVTGRKEL